ncbi:uncharacterized protein MELLADRAFT_95142 [Melampsora larici-populina 98AG31]|uniref:Uncharacterized protein n=1 Tax=Melampsora larici-populina (strain 98AG31 / pathotype 3-4-7) TaxID=747676 RepID=F4RC96_MELLP|nr:uncharacterized protein MELLADRAFT_95142 [Melampsora larici-populina 98AG31]EGG09991.1 hypothetical protein MELLADRAFT_95142 [Melampsora larici-populina 98AG31]
MASYKMIFYLFCHFKPSPSDPSKSIVPFPTLLNKFICSFSDSSSVFSFFPVFNPRRFLRFHLTSSYLVSNSSSMPPPGTPLSGHMNNLFDVPDDGVGDDQQSTSIRQNPLCRVGTVGRETFEKNNQMAIKVRFKIYTNMEVEINTPIQGTPKVGATKKPAKADGLNLIDSEAINTGFLEIKTCPIGMSLNKFKNLVAGACKEYEGGLKKLILNSVFSPNLKWKTTVGRSKVVLDGAVQWKSFVKALEKSSKKMGVVSIKNDNMQVRVKLSDKESATKKLIAATNGNGNGAEDQESKHDKNKQELNTLANQIFSQHAIGTYAGGAMANIATVHIPPNTPEFWYEIKKNQRIHPVMGVDDRVGLQLKGSSQRSHGANHVLRSIGHAQAGGLGLKKKHPAQMPNIKPDIMKIGNKRNGLASTNMGDIKPDLKNIKVVSINEPIYVSSEYESNWDTEGESSSFEFEVQRPSTSHTVQFELFLANCKISLDNVKTQTLLREAGFVSWTDLIPSVQLTESTLTFKGIDWQIANHLMSKAQDCYMKF